jgi:hypothetical protein
MLRGKLKPMLRYDDNINNQAFSVPKFAASPEAWCADEDSAAHEDLQTSLSILQA